MTDKMNAPLPDSNIPKETVERALTLLDMLSSMYDFGKPVPSQDFIQGFAAAEAKGEIQGRICRAKATEMTSYAACGSALLLTTLAFTNQSGQVMIASGFASAAAIGLHHIRGIFQASAANRKPVDNFLNKVIKDYDLRPREIVLASTMSGHTFPVVKSSPA